MANDLVQWNHIGSRRSSPSPEDDSELWDVPPIASAPKAAEGQAAQRADKDAAEARQVGDDTLAFQREGDAQEHRQSRWDWGDVRTWLWIVGMCVGFLMVCAFVYFMPQGRHNQADLPAPVPPARYY